MTKLVIIPYSIGYLIIGGGGDRKYLLYNVYYCQAYLLPFLYEILQQLHKAGMGFQIVDVIRLVP